MTKAEMIKFLTGKYPINEAGAVQIISDLENEEDIECDIYDLLFGFYCDNGEIPYGTATAKDGDPVEWINNAVRSELGM